MAEPKRKLGIPIYDARVAPGGVIEDDDDTFDAEVIDESPSFSERLREQARGGAAAAAEGVRNLRDNGVRDTFFAQPVDGARRAAGADSQRMRERERARGQRREQARVRAEQAFDAKRTREERARLKREAARDPLSKLKLEIAQAGEAYMNSLHLSGILASGQTKATQRAELSGLHQIYASMMVLQCVSPLKEGVNSKSVVTAMGMAASMWMLSPEFRTQMGMFADKIGDAVKSKIEQREERKDDRARGRFEKLAAKGKGDQLAGRWRKRLERIEHADRGHRLPFTAQSAAMTEVALAEAAYADMRRPGADVEGIYERYRTGLTVLYEYVQDDGIEPAEVSQAMRIVVGQRLDKEPKLASVFGELGHGRFTKSAPREVYINGTTETATVWTGDFVDAFGGRTVSAGSFSLRPVQNIDEHRIRSAETLTAELTNVTSVAEMNEAFSQYVSAAVVGRYPDVVEEVRDPEVATRFGRVRSMFAAMADDGLSADEQRFVYSAAYVDAIEIVQQINPELGEAWVAQYGQNWREKVSEQIRLYTQMGETAQREKQSGSEQRTYDFTASATGDAAQERGEDIVDAEVVVDDDVPVDGTSTGFARPAARARGQIDQMIHEGDLLPADEPVVDEVIIDGEVVDMAELVAGRRRLALTAQRSSQVARAVASTRRARVNQHYNDVETGGILGIGSDDSAPLQDPGYQLGG